MFQSKFLTDIILTCFTNEPLLIDVPDFEYEEIMVAFKRDPEVIDALKEFYDGVEEEEDKEANTPQLINLKAGDRSGNTMRLPNGKLVFANEFIVPGVPLTWGEVTKDCTRVPTTNECVERLS